MNSPQVKLFTSTEELHCSEFSPDDLMNVVSFIYFMLCLKINKKTKKLYRSFYCS